MAYPYDDPSGGKIAFYGQREQAPALAKARRGLQFGMTAFSPYENPSERDARARELLSGYGEGLGNIQLAGTRAGQSLWGQEESLAAAERDRAESTRRWEAEMELRRRGPGTMGGSSAAPQYRTPAPAPSGFSPDYGNAPSQWSVGPGTTDPNWKKPTDRLTSTTTPVPFVSGLKKSFMPESQYGTGINTYTGQVVNLDTHQGTKYSPQYFQTSLPSTKGTTSGGGLQEYGDSGITYGAGSEEAYKKAMGYSSSSGRTY